MGSISIVKAPNRLQAVRSASGFENQVPIVLTLLTTPRDTPRIMVSNLRGKVFIQTQDNSLVLGAGRGSSFFRSDRSRSLVGVGRLSGHDWETAEVSAGESYFHPRDKSLEWAVTFR